MVDLNFLDCKWFDDIYTSCTARPSLEDRAGMLRLVGFRYSDRQLEDLRRAVNQGLHMMRQECKPSLVIMVYSLITALSITDQLPISELEKYVENYRAAVEKKCPPDIQQNFD